MSDQAWDRLASELSEVAARFGAAIYVYEKNMVLSAAVPAADGLLIPSVSVDWFDDDTARVRTGWCVDVILEYTDPEPGRTTFVTRLVDAVCSGGATEYAILGPEGDWRGVEWEVRDEHGNRWASGHFDTDRRRAARRIPRWS